MRSRHLAALSVLFATAALLAAASPAFAQDPTAPDTGPMEPLGADTREEEWTADEAAIHSFLALFARDESHPGYKDLRANPPRCATGVVRAARDAATSSTVGPITSR